MPTNVIVNGTFDVNPGQPGFGWTGTDIESAHNENTYLRNGNSGNSVAELNGSPSQVTVMEQDFTVTNPQMASLSFDAALRNSSNAVANEDGFLVEIKDSSGGVIFSETIYPSNTTELLTFDFDVDFPAADTYTISFTELGPNNDGHGAIVDNIALMLCLTTGARIATPTGEALIETLNVGDLVMTRNGPKPIRWIGKKEVTRGHIQRNDKYAPVRIAQGALGANVPTEDLLVSRQHRMLTQGKVVTRMFGEDAIFVSAKHLTHLPEIAIDTDVERFDYFHLCLDAHEVIFANGAPTESLFLGQEVVNMLPQDAVAELELLFPGLVAGTVAHPSAQFIPKGQRQKALVGRLKRNGKPVLEHEAVSATGCGIAA